MNWLNFLKTSYKYLSIWKRFANTKYGLKINFALNIKSVVKISMSGLYIHIKKQDLLHTRQNNNQSGEHQKEMV